MKVYSFFLRCSAALLMLVFLQKAGTGLVLHNLFHGNIAKTHAAGQEHQGNSPGYACNCIDDLLMPFVEVMHPVFSQLEINHSIPIVFFEVIFPIHTTLFTFLRGPPSSIAS